MKKENPERLYRDYCKPKLFDLLASLRLDCCYDKAEGAHLYYRTTDGPAEVLDLVGGFGTTVLGHNNPDIVKALTRAFEANVPFAAQIAVRQKAAELAQRLNDLAPAKGRYYVVFANSGAESVEAAVKHAYKVRFDAIRRMYDRISRTVNDLYHRIGDARLQIELPDGQQDLGRFRDDLEAYNLSQFERFQSGPVVCALKGSFHGKTTSALKLTHSKAYRESFEGLSSIQTVHIDLDRPQRFAEAVEDHQVEFLIPELSSTRIILRREKATTVIALILEVILGEGGVRIVPEATLHSFADAHAKLKIPYIIDEIQSGCGRTGTFFAYAQTPLRAIEPEYLLLSKSLGGALAKTGAAMIHESVYDQDFGILHTSTFAEDELSCEAGLASIDILTRDGGKMMKEIARKGAIFLAKLSRLQESYPDILREARGRGLMMAVEFTDIRDGSPFFRYVGRLGFLSLLVSSWLLHRHRIRTTAPLSTVMKGNPGAAKPAVIRIQPSVSITEREMDAVVAALQEVLEIIRNNNEYCLLAHLLDEGSATPVLRRMEAAPRRPEPKLRFDARTGFIIHPTSIDHLIDYYFPSFRHYPFDAARLEAWWNCICRFLEPDFVQTDYVRSGGYVVQNNLIAVPYLPDYLAVTLRRARTGDAPREERLKLQEIRDSIQDAVTLAKELGDERIPTSMVGLGAYTSIVTDNGTTLNDFEVPVTTGNAFTTALMLMGIEKAAHASGISLENATAAVVGGAGNIGSAIASLLCHRCGHVKIIGRPESGMARLGEARIRCLNDILEIAGAARAGGRDGERTQLRGLAKLIVEEILEKLPERPADGALLDAAIRTRYAERDNRFISIHTNLSAIRDCDVVAIATNSPNRDLIGPRNVKPGAIVCCASLPSNLSTAFKDRMGEFMVFDGGLARLPEGSDISFVGMPGGGLAFGCLSETLLLAFDGRNHSFATGALTTRQVYETMAMAERYGFPLGDFKLGDQVHPADRREG
jgi:acetylornithine/succinyldiaminopimelate/putrescine aminotransferase/predicted amino acid dehydrogenase